MAGLDQDQQAEILRQKIQSTGKNALMLAAHDQPEAVQPLLGAMAGLTQQQQIAILRQTDLRCRNALMLAARHHPKAVQPLLDAMAGLDQDQQAEILRQTNTEGWNALMIAAHHQPDAVGPLLDTIAGLTKQQQITILRQTGLRDRNALMLATCYHPKAVQSLLDAMAGLDQGQQADILLQKNQLTGRNALMCAVCYHPEAMQPLLDAMARLTQQQQIAILRQTDLTGRNALMLAAHDHPDAVGPLFFAYISCSAVDGKTAQLIRKVTAETSKEHKLATGLLNLLKKTPTTDEQRKLIIQYCPLDKLPLNSVALLTSDALQTAPIPAVCQVHTLAILTKLLIEAQQKHITTMQETAGAGFSDCVTAIKRMQPDKLRLIEAILAAHAKQVSKLSASETTLVELENFADSKLNTSIFAHLAGRNPHQLPTLDEGGGAASAAKVK
jgi:ABC-type phosphate/phosphonate transport system substrate-binding protein